VKLDAIDVTATIGLALLVGGIAVIYWPAALMVAGLVLVAVSVLTVRPPA
jgi:hypothetical protein